MSKVKNKIITISGEPASGKSTVVQEIKNKYEKMGYNIHIVSVGNVFRELVKKEYLKTYPDKTEASLADIQNDKEFMSKLHSIDGMVDSEVARKGREINKEERPNDVYIIDSRLAWNNVPESYAIRLTVNEAIAGKRVFKDKTRGAEDQYETLDMAIQKTRERKIGEIERYKERYNVNLSDENNYDLIVDTSYTNTEELADIIIAGEEAYRTGKSYPKNWANPTCFYPLQEGRITGQPTVLGNTIESLAEKIREDGYKVDVGTLEIVKRDGIKYLLEGNHRVFGALSAGKTILPYVVTREEDSSSHRATGSTEYDSYKDCVYDYAEGIEYYGGKIGKIDQLRNFNVQDLLAMNNMKNIEECINSNEER